tara:strand:- start:245 stop:463 length:219 start_codon:yes stop_codon:yes gene_type:complete
MANKNYTLIKDWVEHNGKVFPLGSKICISDYQARDFAEKGYIELDGIPKKAKKTKKAKASKVEATENNEEKN